MQKSNSNNPSFKEVIMQIAYFAKVVKVVIDLNRGNTALYFIAGCGIH